MEELELAHPVLWSVGLIAVAAAAGYVAHMVTFWLAGRFARRTRSAMDNLILAHVRRPSRLIMPLIAISAVQPGLSLDARVEGMLHQSVSLLLVGCVGWLAVALVNSLAEFALARHRMDVIDNLTVRQLRTRVVVFRRVLSLILVTLTLAGMLMTIPAARNFGVSLFASAGVAGIAIGLAARPVLSNLIAGIQIALTQPIRIEDTVIVEGEFGWIEEITTTYVVVRLWDLRRLVLPLTSFIEKPFQNWTRRTSNLLGTAFIYVDYAVPVEAVREELHRILQGSKLWDGKVWNLQVSKTTERTMELRALFGVPDSGKSWDLACLVRERLVAFLRERYPESLPRVRTAVDGTAELIAPGGGDGKGDGAGETRARA